MAMLHVRCSGCHKLVPTGFEVDHEAFKTLTDTERLLECPLCERTQTWTLDDVDRSVFQKV